MIKHYRADVDSDLNVEFVPSRGALASLEQQLEDMSDFDGNIDMKVDGNIDRRLDHECDEICSLEESCPKGQEMNDDDGSFRYGDVAFLVKVMMFVAAAMMSMMLSGWAMMQLMIWLTATQPSATPPVQPERPILQEDQPPPQFVRARGIDKRTQTTHTFKRNCASPQFKL